MGLEISKAKLDLNQTDNQEPSAPLNGETLRAQALNQLVNEQPVYSGLVDINVRQEAINEILNNKSNHAAIPYIPDDRYIGDSKAFLESQEWKNIGGHSNIYLAGSDLFNTEERFNSVYKDGSVSKNVFEKYGDKPLVLVEGNQYEYDPSTNSYSGTFATNSNVPTPKGDANLVVLGNIDSSFIETMNGKPNPSGQGYTSCTITNEIVELAYRNKIGGELGEKIVSSQQFQQFNQAMSSLLGSGERYNVINQVENPRDSDKLNNYLNQLSKQEVVKFLQSWVDQKNSYNEIELNNSELKILQNELNSLVNDYSQSHPIFQDISVTVNPESGKLKIIQNK